MIVVPLLTMGFQVPIHLAVGASIVSVIATSSGSAAAYVRDRITNIRVAMLMEVATTLGALFGATLISRVSERFLFGLFGAVMVFSMGVMLRKRKSDHLPPEQSDELAVKLKLPSSYPDKALGREVAYGVRNAPLAFGLMSLAGLLSALLGIGSGSLKVPAMDGAMHLPIKVSSATSNFMMGVTAAASAAVYLLRGSIQPYIAAPVALGVLVGSWIGVRIMVRLQGIWIRRLFIAMLFIVAVQMIRKAVGGGI